MGELAEVEGRDSKEGYADQSGGHCQRCLRHNMEGQ